MADATIIIKQVTKEGIKDVIKSFCGEYDGSKIYKQFVAETRAYAKKVSIYDWDKALRRSYDYVSCNVNLLHARILGV